MLQGTKEIAYANYLAQPLWKLNKCLLPLSWSLFPSHLLSSWCLSLLSAQTKPCIHFLHFFNNSSYPLLSRLAGYRTGYELSIHSSTEKAGLALSAAGAEFWGSGWTPPPPLPIWRLTLSSLSQSRDGREVEFLPASPCWMSNLLAPSTMKWGSDLPSNKSLGKRENNHEHLSFLYVLV